jgi:hypothetical protein
METAAHRVPFAVIARESPNLADALHRIFVRDLLDIHRTRSLSFSAPV